MCLPRHVLVNKAPQALSSLEHKAAFAKSLRSVHAEASKLQREVGMTPQLGKSIRPSALEPQLVQLLACKTTEGITSL